MSTARSSGSRSCSRRRRTASSSSATTTSRSTAGGSPTSDGSWGWTALPARPAPGGPRGQLPVPGSRRRARRPTGRAQRASVSRRRSAPARQRPAGSSSRPMRPMRPSASSGSWRSWPDDGSTRAVLARTNRELLPGGGRRVAPRPAVPGTAYRPAGRVAPRRRAPRSHRFRRTRRTGRSSLRVGAMPAGRTGSGGARGGDGAPRLGRRLRHPRRADRGHHGHPDPTRRPAARRRAVDARDGPRDERPRVRPRRRGRDGGRPVPERAGRQQRGGSRPRLRGGAPPRRMWRGRGHVAR